MSDTPFAWERQPYETPGMWAMFQFYIEQDPPRSVFAAYKAWRLKRGKNEAVKQTPGTWNNICQGKKGHGDVIPGAMTWLERGLALDDYIADQERQKWIERRQKLKEREWDVGTKLLEKGEQMLMFPVIAQQSADGVSVIMPADWRFKDVPTILAQGSKLARLAADMSTENITLDWREAAKKEGIDVDAIFREVVAKLSQTPVGRGDATGGVPDSPQQPNPSGE